MNVDVMVLQADTELDWVDFEKALFDRFGVNAVTLGKKGERKTAGEIRWANRLCALIQADPNGAHRICRTLLRHLMHEAGVKKRTVSEECGAGMYKLMMPIVAQDRIVGFVSVCGRPSVTTDRIYTGYLHETVDADEEMIKGLLRFLHPIDYRTVRQMKRYIARYPDVSVH